MIKKKGNFLRYAAALVGSFALAVPVMTSGSKAASYGPGLVPEWNGNCQASGRVDVNLGHSPENFVRAAYCQVFGKKPEDKLVAKWAKRLRKDPRLRRIDVVLEFCKDAGKTCNLSYSDPWAGHPELPPANCGDKPGPQIGAVMMFFFHCPGGVNCGMDWANNHAPGMAEPSKLFGWNHKPGYYDPNNPGFWARELRDAKAAGLDFVLPNVYGPDMMQEGRIKTLARALATERDPVKIGMFDDTWAWGEQWFGEFWQQAPNLADAEAAAEKLYTSKWRPFFQQIPSKHWYRVKGRPFIYFYNSGKLKPLNRSSQVMRLMKQKFKHDFGVEPYLVMDHAFFADPALNRVADNKFVWHTLDEPTAVIKNTKDGVTMGHIMARWDDVGRERPGKPAHRGDKLIKGPERLRKGLQNCSDCDIAVIATWNDLGEGTGVNRAYDYYYLGQWLRPDAFMQEIRAQRCR